MSGCPSCTQHLGCTEYNAVLHKRAAVAILELTLAAEREHAARMALQARSAQLLLENA
jgi:DEAD/DEAH box helicase domain-containing protein